MNKAASVIPISTCPYLYHSTFLQRHLLQLQNSSTKSCARTLVGEFCSTQECVQTVTIVAVDCHNATDPITLSSVLESAPKCTSRL
jgi:hypothetical protein